MDKQIILNTVKSLWARLVTYFTSEGLKESFKKAVESCKETIWNSIKDEVHAVAVEIITDAETYLNSDALKEKEEEILEAIMQKINLPLIAKPFKGLIKKVIKNKLEDIVQELVEKAKAIVNQ